MSELKNRMKEDKEHINKLEKCSRWDRNGEYKETNKIPAGLTPKS